MSKQNKASHITEGNKMPDEIWVSYFKPFDYPESCDSPWGVYRINPEQSDSEMTTWGSYIRKDLSIPKKEIEGKITKALERVEHYKLNIKEAYDNYKMHNLQNYPSSLLDFRDFIEDLKALLTGEQ